MDSADRVRRASADTLCSICLNLPNQSEHMSKEVQYGTASMLASIPRCPVCDLITSLLPRAQPTGIVGIDRPIELMTIGRTSTFDVSHGSVSRGSIKLLYSDEEVKIFNKKGKYQIQNTLDYENIRRWIHECERSHACYADLDDTDAGSQFESYFIDVEEQRLVSKPVLRTRYVVLSYVRGGLPVAETRAGNIEFLKRKGSFPKGANLELNRIFHDAMLFTQGVGERYLWIDALCITQDASPQKATMIAKMDSIYSHARLTIIALSAENAESGLPGVRENTRTPGATRVELDRQALDQADNRFPIAYAAMPRSLDTILDQQPYETRGWTFQERLLSRRSLIFTDHQVYFHCREAQWSDLEMTERETSITELDFSRAAFAVKSNSEFEMFDRYCSVVHSFSLRQLTYPADALPAISGVLAVMSREFKWHMMAGMPVMPTWLLERALLWWPGAHPLVRNPAFPSWSWAGWTGAIDWTLSTSVYSDSRPDSTGGCYFRPLKSEAELLEVGDVDNELILRTKVAPLKAVELRGPVDKILSSTFDSTMYSFYEIWTTDTTIAGVEAVHCGILFCPWEEEESSTPWINGDNHLDRTICSYEIICLSRMLFLEAQSEPKDDSSTSPGSHAIFANIFEDVSSLPVKDDCMFNVWLVEQKEGRRERVAIGLLHSVAWAAIAEEGLKTVVII